MDLSEYHKYHKYSERTGQTLKVPIGDGTYETIGCNFTLCEAIKKYRNTPDIAVAVIRAMIEHGASIHATSSQDGWTVLHQAAQYYSIEVMQFLIDEGADINWTTIYRLTPLHRAVVLHNTDAIHALVVAGADVSIAHIDGMTALHIASRNGNLEAVKILVTASVDIDIRDHDGMTPLHHAAAHGYCTVVELLLNTGADRTIVSTNGYTADDYTILSYYNPAYISYLLSRPRKMI